MTPSTQPFQKNSYCSYCGYPFKPEQLWPRTCVNCQNTSFVNPIPVVVILVPVEAGLLLVRRGIEPQWGKLALPGGFIDLGESWQVAGAREVLEETGVTIDPAHIREFGVRSTPGEALLIFGLAAPLTGSDLPPFVPVTETLERVIATEPVELAFPFHTEMMRRFFAGGEG